MCGGIFRPPPPACQPSVSTTRDGLRQLTARGVPVRELVRSAEKAATLAGPGVETVIGDLEQPASLDAALDEIARRAGIGNATLYRRFPTRAALIAAVFAEQMADHLAAVQAALANADPWDGFRSYIRPQP